jgi:DamX protein
MNENTGMAGRHKDELVDEECLQACGLEHQPFSGAHGSFFRNESRATQLSSARTCLRAGAIILLSAPPGGGKTAFLDHLRQTTYDPAIHYVASKPDLRLSDIVDVAGSHSGSDAPSSPWVVLREASPQPALAIDDGHRLPASLVQRLARLQGALADNGLALPLILACRTAEAEALYRTLDAHRSRLVGLEAMALCPFNEADTGAYLRVRFAEAGAEGELLEGRQIERIYRRSGGIPSRIHAEAARELERTTGSAAARVASPAQSLLARRPGGRTGVAAALGVATLAGAGVFVWWQHERLDRQQAVTTPIEIPQKVAAAEPEDTPAKGRNGDAPSGEDGRDSPADKPSDSEAAGDDNTSGRTSGGGEQLEPLVSEQARAQPETAESPAETTREASSNHRDGSNDKIAENQLPAFELDETWFAERPPEHFTIQLLGAEEPVTVRRFLSRVEENRGLRIVLSQRDGRAWYAIVTGDYAERAAAKEAINELPPGWRDRDPFPRTFKSLLPGG